MTTDDHDERSRLLSPVEEGHGQENSAFSSSAASNVREGAKATPLPWRPLSSLLILNAMQPLAYDLIFPFVNQMILEVGITDDPERVGFYSGLIESVFAIMSFLAIMPCTRLSDVYGRKPIVLFGISSLGISVACFGLSRTLWQMIVTRCIGGAVGGSWATMKIMLAELTDKSNQAAAFSMLVVSYRLGQISGQPIGGYLSHPERLSSIFDVEFFRTYPFSLPCLVVAVVAVCTAAAGLFMLQETLPSKLKKTKHYAYDSIVPPMDDAVDAPYEPPHEAQKKGLVWYSVLTPAIVNLLVSNFVLVLASETIFALYPLFSFTPILSGGLGLTESQIGTHTAIRSFLSLLSQGFYSPLERALGTVRVYQLSMFFWPIAVAGFPLLNYMACIGLESTWAFQGALFLFWSLWSFSCLAWSGATLLLNNHAPSSEALATLNGVAMMGTVLPQAIAPAFVTTLFAYSRSSGILNGHLYWIVLMTISSLGAIQTLTVKEATTDWRLERDSSE